MEEHPEQGASENAEKVPASGGRLTGELSFFKSRKLVRRFYQTSHS